MNEEERVELVALSECPPGLFLFDGTLGFKTEYGATTGKDVGGGKVEWTVTGYSDPYCVESGEVFWGGTSKHEDREKLLVQPVDATALMRNVAPTAPVQDDDAEGRAWDWLVSYAEQRHKEVPEDLSFSADQMVDAFIAGAGTRLSADHTGVLIDAVRVSAQAFRTLEEVAVAQLEHDKARNFIKLGDKCRAALAAARGDQSPVGESGEPRE